ncbi:MAG TPA: heme exporter protein CcmD [Burkholderiaceae bacterium]
MIWNSWSEFFAMGGYGLYVWGSVAVVAICMFGEMAGLRMRRKALIDQLRVVQRVAAGGRGRK